MKHNKNHDNALAAGPPIGSLCRAFLNALCAVALMELIAGSARAQATNYILGTTNMLVGPSAGSNSAVLGVSPTFGSWTASANTSWLALDTNDQTGTGSTNVIFTYEANSGPTRSGTLTIAGQTVTVTQAGSAYVQAPAFPTIIAESTNVFVPEGLAMDGAGDVYIADSAHNEVKEWIPTNNTLVTLVSNLDRPSDIAVDSAGNVYIVVPANSEVYEWSPIDDSVTTPISIELSNPYGVAVDQGDNVYIADSSDNAIKEWEVVNSNAITILAGAAQGVINPSSVAVDVAGNVYFADSSPASNGFNKIAVNSRRFTILIPGVHEPEGVAVDGSGNVYGADSGHNDLKEWVAANGSVTVWPFAAFGVAVDSMQNIYFSSANTVQELPYAFVDPTPKSEGPSAGSDSLPPVLPQTENLLPPFAPISSQPWLVITGITNDVISFAFSENDTGTNRTASIILLGTNVLITQAGTNVVIPPNLSNALVLSNGVFQFSFANSPNGSFTVISTTNLAVPFSNWIVAGSVSNLGGGQFQFTSQPATNGTQMFYSVRSP